MIKEFVLYKEALELYKLGFNEQCIAEFDKSGQFKMFTQRPDMDDFELFTLTNSQQQNEDVCAPTYSQAFKWFGKTFNLFPLPVIDQTSNPKFSYEICVYKGNFEWGKKILAPYLYRTQEESNLECLKHLIVITKKKLINDNS